MLASETFSESLALFRPGAAYDLVLDEVRALAPEPHSLRQPENSRDLRKTVAGGPAHDA